MKIQNITINKYKAFTKKERIPIGGSNVFIYGENGSGKSSFYYALKDFFQSSVEPVQMSELRNFNLTDDGTDCSIKIDFDKSLYERRDDAHHHFSCKNCGQIFDVDMPICGALKNCAIEGHKIEDFQGYFYGICHACQEKAK